MLTSDPVSTLPFVGPKQSANLARLGILNLEGLLYHIPVYYRDTSNIITLAQLNREQKQTVKVIIEDLRSIRIRGGRTMQKGIISDSSGTMKVTWFNQPFLTKALPIGSEAYLSGKLSPKSLQPELVAPDYELVKETNINLGRIVPIYPLTKGVSVKWLRARMHYLISHLNQVTDLTDKLPEELKQQHQLIDLKLALREVHQPDSSAAIELARKRLAFDELLQIYLKLIRARRQRKMLPDRQYRSQKISYSN